MLLKEAKRVKEFRVRISILMVLLVIATALVKRSLQVEPRRKNYKSMSKTKIRTK